MIWIAGRELVRAFPFRADQLMTTETPASAPVELRPLLFEGVSPPSRNIGVALRPSDPTRDAGHDCCWPIAFVRKRPLLYRLWVLSGPFNQQAEQSG
jgi:hypothetical protein